MYFHLQPAFFDCVLTLLTVLVVLHIFRVRDPALRAIFLLLPLLRPPIILIQGASQVEQLPVREGMMLGIRFPDPFNLLPDDILGSQEGISTVSIVVAQLMLIALIVSLGFFFFRWAGFVLFYHRLERRKAQNCGAEWARVDCIINSLCQEMNPHRPPRLLLLGHSKWATPCTFGWRRPTIVMESELAGNLADFELRAILAHELGHVIRRDGLWRWVAVLLRDIQCFNPFSHICMGKLELEREKACDSLAVQRGGIQPRTLAKCLVKLSQIFLYRDAQPFPGHSMSLLTQNQSSLEHRVKFLLEMPATGRTRSFERSHSRLLKLLMVLMIWAPIATLQIYACIFLGSYALVVM